MPEEDEYTRLLQDVLTDFLILGGVRSHGQWRVYAGTLGEWTLDYIAYEPEAEFVPLEEIKHFRNGLLRIDENNAEAFCFAMQSREVPLDVLKQWVEMSGVSQVQILMMVDFDNCLFVHGYSEPIEPKGNYIPSHWKGIVGNPLDYLPEEISSLWRL